LLLFDLDACLYKSSKPSVYTNHFTIHSCGLGAGG
jgi:hypothetical protein